MDKGTAPPPPLLLLVPELFRALLLYLERAARCSPQHSHPQSRFWQGCTQATATACLLKKNDEGDDASVIIGVTCFKVGMFSKLLSRHTSGGPAARPPSPSPFSHWFTRFAERLAGLRGCFQGCLELLVLRGGTGMLSCLLHQAWEVRICTRSPSFPWLWWESHPRGHPITTLWPRTAAQSQAAARNCCPAPQQLILCSSRCPSKCQEPPRVNFPVAHFPLP